MVNWDQIKVAMFLANELGINKDDALRLLKEIVAYEAPRDLEKIAELEKRDLRIIAARDVLGAFLPFSSYTDDQLHGFWCRMEDLWEEYPSEPAGRYVETVLWTSLDRRENIPKFHEILYRKKKLSEPNDEILNIQEKKEYHRTRRKVENGSYYDDPEEVPESLTTKFIRLKHWRLNFVG